MDVSWSGLVYGTMDVEEPVGWVKLEAVLVVPDNQNEVVRVLELNATDEAGVVLALDRAQRDEFARRFVTAFYRGKGRHGGGVQQG